MEVLQALNQFNAKLSNRVLRHSLVRLNEFEEVVSAAIFKDDPKMVSSFVPIVEFQNASMT